jgi:hypothetical protein
VRIPAEVFTVLIDVVRAMVAGRAITVASHAPTLSIQEAADLLGVSCPRS